MKFNFNNAAELLEILEKEKINPADYMVKREAFIADLSEEEVLLKLDQRIKVTRASILKGLLTPQHSPSGLSRGSAVLYYKSEKKLIKNGIFRRACAYALAINEVNASGGRIVAFPTAGSSGIVPGAIWAYSDEKNNAPFIPPEEDAPYNKELRDAFLIASLTAVIIAQKATLAGAEGGCQAECGSASAMAASALSHMEGLGPEDCFNAAALSLKNSLGLACDPVAGLVEVPCVKRNAFSVTNALLAVDLTLSGIKSIIPFDEVVLAMKKIGDSMSPNIRENALGGLAATPTGIEIKNRFLS